MSDLTLSAIGTELLDDPSADPGTVRAALHDLTRSNRWFGGTAAACFGLRRVLIGTPRGTTLSLLDIGTGAGDLPRAAVGWAAQRGWRLEPAGLERSRVAADVAAAAMPMAVGCASAPPFRDKSVDVVLVSQVVHHLAPSSAIALFRTCDRLARRGVVISDLRRSTAARFAFGAAGRVLGFDPVTVTDGMTSIRRGYAADELADLLRAAGIVASVARRPISRLVATWRSQPH